MKKQIKVAPKIRDLCMLILILWLINPYQEFLGHWYLYGALWIVWIMLAYATNISAFKNMLFCKNSLKVFLWPIFIFGISLIGRADFALYQFTVPFIMISFLYYARAGYYSSLKVFLFFSAAYIVIINIVSIIRMTAIPRLARILASSDKSITKYYATPFSANFEHIVGIMLLSLILIVLIKRNSIPKAVRVITSAFLIINIITMIKAQYTIALITFIVFSLIVLIMQIDDMNNRTVVLAIIGSIGIIAILFYSQILNGIASVIPDSIIRNRIIDLANASDTSISLGGSDFGDRMYLYLLSLNTFLNNPLFGVGGLVFRANGLVGGHSALLDNLAYYGIIGGLCFIINISSAMKSIKNCFSQNGRANYKIICIVFWINLVLNLCYRDEIFIYVFFLIPSIIYLLDNNSENEFNCNTNRYRT